MWEGRKEKRNKLRSHFLCVPPCSEKNEIYCLSSFFISSVVCIVPIKVLHGEYMSLAEWEKQITSLFHSLGFGEEPHGH